ncbi:MAG: hypothetical protein Q8P64_02735, partial [Deltaproteobacteria bacterium]|nr:hypothetical protein [Deltaproteobacteria bacterium]
DQKTKEPFPRAERFTERVIDSAFENGLVLYPGTGFVDGVNGDMVMVGPPLIIEENQIDEIIELLKKTFIQILESGLRLPAGQAGKADLKT